MKTVKTKNAKEFSRAVEAAKRDGYVAIYPNCGSVRNVGTSADMEGFNEQLSCFEESCAPHREDGSRDVHHKRSGLRSNTLTGNSATMLDYPQTYQMCPQPVNDPSASGRFIPWGRDNNMPTMVFRTAGASPYTASSIDYTQRTMNGLGPRLMYHIHVLSNGHFVDKLVPYECAGKILEAAGQAEEYAEWARSSSLIEELMEDTNIPYLYRSFLNDFAHLGVGFPCIHLSRGKARSWDNAHVVSIDYMPAAIARFEEKDDEWKIRRVYLCERWRDEPTAKMEASDVVSYPVAMPLHALRDIRNHIKSHLTNNEGRELHWVCPILLPQPTKGYYPQLPWWSIFPSQVYQYANTLIYDRNVARKNGTMWGKILFINLAYLKQVFDAAGATTQEAQDAIRGKIYDSVENFLKNRDNNGQLLLMDSYPSVDEKQMMDSIRIVDVPQASTTKEDKEELQQISNTVYSAFSVNSIAFGASPGSTSSSGTMQREVHLLKSIQLAPDQQLFIDFLNWSTLRLSGISRSFRWIIENPTLSTLDRSNTGIVSTTTD